MPNANEKQILKKICKLISFAEQQCTAKDYLIMLFEDYLNIQPVQKYFFLNIINSLGVTVEQIFFCGL